MQKSPCYGGFLHASFLLLPSGVLFPHMETLGKLFGGTAKVKIMRLFLLNPEKGYENKDIAFHTRVAPVSVRREVASLYAMDFIKKKTFSKEIRKVIKRGKKKEEKIIVKRVAGWIFNQKFEYRESLQDLLIDAEFITKEDLAKRFKNAGRIKLLITAGIFTKDPDSRLDILLVGDNLNRNFIEKNIRLLEAEIGKELEYGVFETAEFVYRSNMYDKLIRDVIDFPHQCIIDTGLLNQVMKAQ